ncbi:MAG: hypothetical protein L3J46_07805 [Kangiellaceae bacterium]|nr:hypothetical protein [Kangiellaceae bacterium]
MQRELLGQSLIFVLRAAGRRLIVSLLIILVSACNQTENPVNLDKSDVSATKTASADPYGRKAEFSYPDFTGSFAVATRTVVVSDPSRIETLGLSYGLSQNSSLRKIQIRFYYPSSEDDLDILENKKRLPVIAAKTWSYLIGHHELQGKRLRFNNYHKARWNIKLNTKIAEQQASYPLLIFSHGYGYNAEAYSALSAELASRGFIVASINHTYGANPVDFNLEGFDKDSSGLDDRDIDNSDLDNLIWAKPLIANQIGAFLPIWSADQMLVIDHLSFMNSDSDDLFFQKLQLSNIGLLGHSYGGAASFHTAAQDPRVRAVMNLDGTIFDFENKTITQPLALVLSEEHQLSFNFENVINDAFLIKFKKFKHASFSDHPLWWQWDHDDLELGFGTVDAHRNIELTANLVDQFFSRYLLNKQNTMFESNMIDNMDMLLLKK